MSAARCYRVWKLPIGTPNCFRVLSFPPCSSASVPSRRPLPGPSPCGLGAGRARSAASRSRDRRWPHPCRPAPVKVMAAPCRPSWVAVRSSLPGGALPVRAGASDLADARHHRACPPFVHAVAIPGCWRSHRSARRFFRRRSLQTIPYCSGRGADVRAPPRWWPKFFSAGQTQKFFSPSMISRMLCSLAPRPMQPWRRTPHPQMARLRCWRGRAGLQRQRLARAPRCRDKGAGPPRRRSRHRLPANGRPPRSRPCSASLPGRS